MPGLRERDNIHNPAPPPQPEKVVVPETTHAVLTIEQPPPIPVYVENKECLVFPVCNVFPCSNQRIMTTSGMIEGTMILTTGVSEAIAQDLLALHFREHHGITETEGQSELGFLLPRRE